LNVHRSEDHGAILISRTSCFLRDPSRSHADSQSYRCQLSAAHQCRSSSVLIQVIRGAARPGLCASHSMLLPPEVARRLRASPRPAGRLSGTATQCLRARTSARAPEPRALRRRILDYLLLLGHHPAARERPFRVHCSKDWRGWKTRPPPYIPTLRSRLCLSVESAADLANQHSAALHCLAEAADSPPPARPGLPCASPGSSAAR